MKISFLDTVIEIRFSLVAVLCLSAMLPGRLLPLLMSAVLLHEAGHLCYILAVKLPVRAVIVSLRGVQIKLRDAALTVRQTILLNASGPLANLLSAAAALLFPWGFSSQRFAAVSAAVALVTLMPLPGSDGGALLRTGVISFWGESGLHRFQCISRITACLLMPLFGFLYHRIGWRWYYLASPFFFAASLVEDSRRL